MGEGMFRLLKGSFVGEERAVVYHTVGTHTYHASVDSTI